MSIRLHTIYRSGSGLSSKKCKKIKEKLKKGVFDRNIK